MKWVFLLGFMLAILLMGQSKTQAFYPFGAAPSSSYQFSCGYTTLVAQYSVRASTYNFTGACLQQTTQLQIPYTAVGSFGPTKGETSETITMAGPSPYRGSFRVTMICDGLQGTIDPWLGQVLCREGKWSAQGEFKAQSELVDLMWRFFLDNPRPFTSSFPYDRKPLLAQRDVELKNEAMAQQRAEQMRNAALQPKSLMNQFSYPAILTPAKGQRFFAQSIVPIKLAPPTGWSASSYMISIQRRDSKGNWVFNSNPIPVSAAEVQSAAGYTGFGAGGNGATKYPGLLTAPGAWRLNAQISAPRQSNWSDWVEFTVTAPPPLAVKGVQKGFTK